MKHVLKLWSRLAAGVSGAILALVIPVHAWAAGNGVADGAVEAAKYRGRRGGLGFFGFFGGLCCLFVVAAIVLVVLLITRSRRRK